MTKQPENPIEFTQEMNMHLNFGEGGHGYNYRVFANGAEIGSRWTRRGKEEMDVFCVDGDEFDVIANGMEAAKAWLTERAQNKEHQS